jgi:hypothetical protein
VLAGEDKWVDVFSLFHKQWHHQLIIDTKGRGGGRGRGEGRVTLTHRPRRWNLKAALTHRSSSIVLCSPLWNRHRPCYSTLLLSTNSSTGGIATILGVVKVLDGIMFLLLPSFLELKSF